MEHKIFALFIVFALLNGHLHGKIDVVSQCILKCMLIACFSAWQWHIRFMSGKFTMFVYI